MPYNPVKHLSPLNALDSTNTTSLAIGEISRHRTLPVLVHSHFGFDSLDLAYGGDDDHYHLVNLSTDKGYFDSIAVNGAYNDAHATALATEYCKLLGVNATAEVVGGFDCVWDGLTLQKLVSDDSQNVSYKPMITKERLTHIQQKITGTPALWDGLTLKSHNGDVGALFYELVKYDGLNELLTPTSNADLPAILGEIAPLADTVGFDALVETNGKLEQLKNRLAKALQTASDNELSVSNFMMSAPFSKAGKANVYFEFELSDGQIMRIFFHNPDSTPNKLTATDVMVSWKWTLNNKDVTAIISPNQSESVSIATLAQNMMRIARQNSKRFTAGVARRNKAQNALNEATAQLSERQAYHSQVLADIDALREQIKNTTQAIDDKAKGVDDEGIKDVANTNNRPPQPPVYITVTEIDYYNGNIPNPFYNFAEIDKWLKSIYPPRLFTESAGGGYEKMYFTLHNAPLFNGITGEFREYGDVHSRVLIGRNDFNPNKMKLEKYLSSDSYYIAKEVIELFAKNKKVNNKKKNPALDEPTQDDVGVNNEQTAPPTGQATAKILVNEQTPLTGQDYTITKDGDYYIATLNFPTEHGNNRGKHFYDKDENEARQKAENFINLYHNHPYLNRTWQHYDIDSEEMLDVVDVELISLDNNDELYEILLSNGRVVRVKGSKMEKFIQESTPDEISKRRDDKIATEQHLNERKQKAEYLARAVENIKVAFFDKTSVEINRAKSQLIDKDIHTQEFGVLPYIAFIEKAIDELNYRPRASNSTVNNGTIINHKKLIYIIADSNGLGYELNKTQYMYAKWYYEQKTPNQNDEPIQENKPMNEPTAQNPNYTQADIDYLQSIIDKAIDLETVDMDKMIEIGEKDENDPLYAQALQIVSDYLDEMSQ